MTKKTQSKKATSSKSKKPTKKTANKVAKQESTSRQATVTDYKDLFYGTISALAVYVFALWAIDSGSLWVYGLTFAAVYYTAHYYRLFFKNKFFNKGKAK